MCLAVIVTGCSTSNTHDRRPTNRSLRSELLAMKAADQRLRDAVFTRGQTNLVTKLEALDRVHTERMRQVLSTNGWPGKSLVGAEGSSAAWLLVQHATHDLCFMKSGLALMAEAVRTGEASPQEFAYLMDRIRLQDGKSQVYGTQFIIGPDKILRVQPIEDPAHVDNLREQIGLPPMAEYERQLRKLYGADSGTQGR